MLRGMRQEAGSGERSRVPWLSAAFLTRRFPSPFPRSKVIFYSEWAHVVRQPVEEGKEMFLARRSLVPVVMATGMLLLTVAGPNATKGDTIPLAEVGRDTPATGFRDPVGEHLYKVAFAP